jgi:ABC-type uncharacterized transport system auxiliary subunit
MPASRLWSVLAALCATLVVAGCGGKKLKADSIETQIKDGIVKKTKADVKSVDCPEDRPVKQGDVFSCTVTLANGFKAPVRVTQVDDKGNLRWRVGA